MSEGNLKQILTLGNSIIGVSILAMPYCLKQCGLVLGIVLLIISGYINRVNCHFLIKSAISTKRRSYEFLAFHIFGPMGKFAIEVIQIGFLFGICVSFFVIAGDLGPKILAQVLDIEYTARFRAFFLCGLCFFIVLPLSLLRNTDSLASISAISITFYVLLVLKIVSDSWLHIVSGSWQARVELWRPAGVLQALPIMSLALACQTNIFSIYESLPDPSLSRMNAVVAGAINLCSSVYILVGFFGYVAFHDVPFGGNILVQLLPSPVTRWINIGFVMSIALGFPLVVYPCRVSVNSLLFRRPGSSLELPQNHIPELRFKCITFCILMTAMSIGIVIPSIEVVLGLLGSTMGTAIAILFPSVMFIKNSSRSNLEKMAAQTSFLVGIVLLVCGTYMNLYAVDQLSQGPVPAPAVTAPPALPVTPAAPAHAAGISNVTERKDVIPEKAPGDSGGGGQQGEARKEPAVPEPPSDERNPAPDSAGKKPAGDGKTDGGGENKPAEKGKTGADKAENADNGKAPADGGVSKNKSKSKHGGSKKDGDSAAKAEADAGAAKSAPDADKPGEALDVGALRKEEEERRREEPAAKELERKQAAVLEKLEQTHQEQKELLQEQKALLKEMKEQRAQPAAQQPAAAQQPGAQQPVAAQQPNVLQPAAVQQPNVQQPVAAQQPNVQQPVAAQQPNVQQPVAAQQPNAQQPAAVQQPNAQQPAAQQPAAVQQPAAQQPAAVQQPNDQQPAAVQQLGAQQSDWQQYIPDLQQQQNAADQPAQQQVRQPVQQQYVPNQQQQPVVNQPQTVLNQQPAFNQQQPILNQQQAAFNQQQPLVNQQQPVLNQQQPVLNLNQPPPQVNQQQAIVNQQQPPVNQQQPLVNQQSALNLNQQPPAASPAANPAPLPAGQSAPAPIPLAGTAGAAGRGEQTQPLQQTSAADDKQEKHAAGGRVKREAGRTEDEMLVPLADNWAAVDAAAARNTGRRR